MAMNPQVMQELWMQLASALAGNRRPSIFSNRGIYGPLRRRDMISQNALGIPMLPNVSPGRLAGPMGPPTPRVQVNLPFDSSTLPRTSPIGRIFPDMALAAMQGKKQRKPVRTPNSRLFMY